ncbi:hypothetical protein DS909_07985 [Phaeobacter gallaeciensis]|uniref:Bacteriophage-like protein n=2 Tax=Roseobacteraceae TaxID=2854170 RepID=A0A366X6L5_9RHOB|nr:MULTISPECIES: hypothetical protein [Roseobacteraceae]MBT3141350.1 hypothetical protein [Falsiruegeria litorea]MBT8167694.1 hypothetical protein [Falsiruegeria litorea]RBW57624.1 hypothetical protein DS909_07985 [Phaeobacter gallaeciensis]
MTSATRQTPAPRQTIPGTVIVHIPFRLVKRGGRKEMLMPEGASSQRKMDNTLVKALARAFRWKRMLKSGAFTTIGDLAEREGIAPSYLTRVLRLTLLAPDVVEAILGRTQEPEVSLARLLEPFPADWQRQPDHFKQ